jgi:hypothetical protein
VQGSFDAYIVFLERGVSLLAPEGRLGFIVPNKLLKLEYAERLRGLFAREALVEEIVDFGDAQIFEEATNYSCILMLDRAGADELTYRRVTGDRVAVRQALTDVDDLPAERFPLSELGSEPWILAAGEEAAVIRAARDQSERLADVTKSIFTGLQTSADRIYIVEDLGPSGSNRLVYSRASGRQLELEADLLHPLASGGDVGRYAFESLRYVLLFPYSRDGASMRLLTRDELAALPLTAAYLLEHEEDLRARENGRMDHDGWYAFGRTQSLGSHDSMKLGVPRLCERLRASVDADGAVYLDNVDVNGILLRENGPSVWSLAVLLNSQLLDFIFRRGSVPFRGAFYSANKQFIEGLPIRLPNQAGELEDIGRRLHETATEVRRETGSFIAWLEDIVGARVRDLSGTTVLVHYGEHEVAELIETLRANRSNLRSDPTSRSFRERLQHEHAASRERLGRLRERLAAGELAADQLVYDVYGLNEVQRRLVDSEFL